MANASSHPKSITASLLSISLVEKPKFVRPLSNKYLCSNCQEILHPPVKQSACGHRFCAVCIQDIQGRDERPLCPANEEDCVELTNEKIFPDRGTDRELMNLLVHCPNLPRCKEQMKWRLLNHHIGNDCQFNEVSCPNAVYGCDARYILSDKENHLLKCRFKPIVCKFCEVDFVEKTIDQHEQKCQLEAVTCFYAEDGCLFKGTRKDVLEHAKEKLAAHLELATKRGRKQAKIIAELDKRLIAKEKEQVNSGLSADFLQLKYEVMALKAATEERSQTVGQSVTSASMQSNLDTDKVHDLESRLSTLEGRAASGPEAAGDARHLKAGVCEDESKIIRSNERTVGLHDVTLAEYEIRFRCLETANYNGVLLWKITSFETRKKAARDGRTLSVYSQPFYTEPYGYKMCARIYLDGDGMGKGTHASLYFVVMKGEYDALLPWPFRHRVTMILLDQDSGRKHIRDTFRPDPTSTSFRRPANTMNVASGSPLFVSQSTLETSKYLRDDTIYIMVKIDLSDATHITNI